MPTCDHCNYRKFLNKEALHQHLSSSGNEHPFCEKCQRRFISLGAREAHMAAKHPPTYDCVLCDRSFNAPFALDDHYRGSSAHPNCHKCGKGFKDVAERFEHHKIAHILVPCGPCGGAMVYEESLEEHYRSSANHVTCSTCQRGFKDEAAHTDHIALVHPELRCDPCGETFTTIANIESHYSNSEVHKKCYKCGCGFKDEVAYHQHLKEAHQTQIYNPIRPEIQSIDSHIARKSQVLLPPPSEDIRQAWGAKKNIQIGSSIRPAMVGVPLHLSERAPALLSNTHMQRVGNLDTVRHPNTGLRGPSDHGYIYQPQAQNIRSSRSLMFDQLHRSESPARAMVPESRRLSSFPLFERLGSNDGRSSSYSTRTLRTLQRDPSSPEWLPPPPPFFPREGQGERK